MSCKVRVEGLGAMDDSSLSLGGWLAVLSFLPSFLPALHHLPSFPPSFLHFALVTGLRARVGCMKGVDAATSLGLGAKASWGGLGSQFSKAIGDYKSRWPPPPKSQTASKRSSHDHIQGLRW